MQIHTGTQCPPMPRGLRREQAADYLGVSPSKFDQARKMGLIPTARHFLGVVLYDRQALDRMFEDLPFENAPAANDNEWDIALRGDEP
ncbi:hypothetical protein H8B02_23000 [Bradyrhizobium sp. Pear77]|uniref:hypothetical protein n=1 Tax=Bradyrhizobium altum TaxID=1571202 RepID=UPI001E2901D5|nr:hypothetical protein [Bradyrhizobium altum]MCC8956191.1 hypothetical protein [Bradyrhizobium altum]